MKNVFLFILENNKSLLKENDFNKDLDPQIKRTNVFSESKQNDLSTTNNKLTEKVCSSLDDTYETGKLF